MTPILQPPSRHPHPNPARAVTQTPFLQRHRHLTVPCYRALRQLEAVVDPVEMEGALVGDLGEGLDRERAGGGAGACVALVEGWWGGAGYGGWGEGGCGVVGWEE